jgi:hypothetical protein
MSIAAAAICLALGAKTVALPTDHLTLAWRHSVEKSGWEEDYAVRGDRLVLKEARIEGTGAGMEPPPDAVLRGGWWHYVPRLPPLPEVRLTLSPYTADYRLCWDGSCRRLGRLLGVTGETAVVTLRPCSSRPAEPHRAR